MSKEQAKGIDPRQWCEHDDLTRDCARCLTATIAAKDAELARLRGVAEAAYFWWNADGMMRPEGERRLRKALAVAFPLTRRGRGEGVLGSYLRPLRQLLQMQGLQLPARRSL
jgi:hypothetical protein